MDTLSWRLRQQLVTLDTSNVYCALNSNHPIFDRAHL